MYFVPSEGDQFHSATLGNLPSRRFFWFASECLLCILGVELTDPDIFGEDEAQNPFLGRELRLGHLSWTDIVIEPLRKSYTDHQTSLRTDRCVKVATSHARKDDAKQP